MLLQSGRLDAHVGGAEANVAVGLARLGHEAAMVSRVPDNALGDAAAGHLRRYGVDTAGVTTGPGRMGLYFLSPGAGVRPSDIVYDREGSAFALAGPGDFDWDALLDGAELLHLSGVTPALGRASADVGAGCGRGGAWQRGSGSRSTAITARSSGRAGTAIRRRSSPDWSSAPISCSAIIATSRCCSDESSAETGRGGGSRRRRRPSKPFRG